MQELIDNFSLERVSKSGARFQPDKAKWFNAQYMHHKSDAELAALYQPSCASTASRFRTSWPGVPQAL